MTFKIMKSQKPEGFEVAVAAHALEMRNWRAHMVKVKADQIADVEPAKRHVGYDKPTAHPFVAEAVNESDVADYEIVDDGPTPDQVLVSRKAALMHVVSVAEAEKIVAVVPAGKRRLFNLRETEIVFSTPKVGVLKSITNAVGLGDGEPSRSPEDQKFLGEQAARRDKVAAIERAAAQMHSDIEDLTSENIDSWVMPKFPD